jgi:hypothetical protein
MTWTNVQVDWFAARSSPIDGNGLDRPRTSSMPSAAPPSSRLNGVASSRRCGLVSLGLAVDVYRIDVSLVEVGGLLCLLVVVVAVIAAGVFIGTRLAQRRR